MNVVGLRNEFNRIQWVQKTLEQLPFGSRLLDAGAGEQQFKKFCSHLIYISQDFAKYDGQGDQRGLQTGVWDQSQIDIISDITEIPEPDFSFDAILCTEVLEHLPNPILAIKEFSRLLKPGGCLIITAPFCSLTHFSPYHFYTGFNRYFYEVQLPQYDFEILELSINGNFFEYLAQELHRLPAIAEQYAKSPLRRWERISLRAILNALKRFSDKDQHSSELLNFGYHVLALKTPKVDA